MLVTVAAEVGPDMAQLLDAPFWFTLYTFRHLEERAARAELVRRRERVDAGFMTAHAFNKPEQLLDELRAVREAIESFERGPDDDAWAPSRAKSLAMLQRSDEITAAMHARGETPGVEVLH